MLSILNIIIVIVLTSFYIATGALLREWFQFYYGKFKANKVIMIALWPIFTIAIWIGFYKE